MAFGTRIGSPSAVFVRSNPSGALWHHPPRRAVSSIPVRQRMARWALSSWAKVSRIDDIASPRGSAVKPSVAETTSQPTRRSISRMAMPSAVLRERRSTFQTRNAEV